MSEVRLAGVGVELGGRQVLSDVDLLVRSGEWLGLIGPNGAGKTTLLRVIANALPSSGSVTIGGRVVATRKEMARLIATVPQRPSLPPMMRVAEYVLMGRAPYLSYFGSERSDDLAVAADAMAALDLNDLVGRNLGELSGGEQQRVLLARALAQRTPVLILDEPIASLDVGHQQLVLELVESIRVSRGLTVLTAIHDLTMAAQFCDRLALVSGGRVVAEGSASSVLTVRTIRQHYGADVRVMDDGSGGIVVIPVRDSEVGRDRGTIVGGHEYSSDR